MNRIPFLMAITAIISLWSCTKEEETPKFPSSVLVLNFSATGAGEELEFRKEFKDPLSRVLFVEFFKYYLSNVYLIDGSRSIKILDVALITHFDATSSDPNAIQTSVYLDVDPGSYTALKIGIGLDAETNATDPNDPSLEIGHPLSSDQNTHWGQWGNYKFIMLEGRWDNNADGSPNAIYGYHTGFDEFYREKTFEKTIVTTSNDTTHLKLNIEYNEIFFGNDTLDMAVDGTWHGTDTSYLDPARAISDNFIQTLTLE